MYARGPSSNMCWGASVFALPSRFCFCSFVLKPPLYGTQGHYRPKTLQWQNPGSQRRICGKKRDFQLWGQRSSLDDFEEISEHNSSCPYCGIQSVDVDRSGNILRSIHQRLLVTADIPSPRSFTRQFACESIVNPGHEWTRCANTDTQLQTR